MEKDSRGEESKGYYDVASIKKTRKEGERLKEITKNITGNLRFGAAKTGGGKSTYIIGREFPSVEWGVLEGDNRGGAAQLRKGTK